MAGLSDISLGNFTNVVYGAPSTYSVADFSTLGDVQTVGDISDEATIVDVQAYGKKYLKKLVGSANASAIEVACNYDPSDPGQQDLMLAYEQTTQRAIGIVMNTGEFTANPFDVDGHHVSFNALIASATVSNSFDETRTITFSVVPVNGTIDKEGSNGYKPNDPGTTPPTS